MKKRKKAKQILLPAAPQSFGPMTLLLYFGIGTVLLYYCIYLSIEFVIYEKTVGVLLYSDKETVSEEVYMPSKNRGYYRSREHYTLYHEHYTYYTGGKKYTSNRYSRMIIYPEIPHTAQSVTVYYNSYAPQYSVLVPVTLPYWLINNAFLLIYIITTAPVLIFRKRTGIRKKQLTAYQS